MALDSGDETREVVRAAGDSGKAGGIVRGEAVGRVVLSDGFDVGVGDPDELRTNDGRDVFERVRGPDANEIRGDLEDASKEEHSKGTVRRDLDSPVELLSDDRSQRLPVAVVDVEDACRRLDGGDEDPVVVIGHTEVVVGAIWLGASFLRRVNDGVITIRRP